MDLPGPLMVDTQRSRDSQDYTLIEFRVHVKRAVRTYRYAKVRMPSTKSFHTSWGTLGKTAPCGTFERTRLLLSQPKMLSNSPMGLEDNDQAAENTPCIVVRCGFGSMAIYTQPRCS